MVERTEAERVRRARIGALIIAGVLVFGGVAFVLGTTVGRGSESGAGDRQATDVDCDTGTSRHPRSGVCVPDAEACTAWLDGTADRAVQCRAESLDGRAYLTIALQGQGSAVVQVSDADGTRHDQQYFFSDSRELDLTGLSGSWTLRVVFEDAAGSARITLWG